MSSNYPKQSLKSCLLPEVSISFPVRLSFSHNYLSSQLFSLTSILAASSEQKPKQLWPKKTRQTSVSPATLLITTINRSLSALTTELALLIKPVFQLWPLTAFVDVAQMLF